MGGGSDKKTVEVRDISKGIDTGRVRLTQATAIDMLMSGDRTLTQ